MSLDYGLKISKPGVSVLTATDVELLISSKFPMFKIYSQGTFNLKMYKTQLNGAITSSQTTITVDSTTGFRSAGYFWVDSGTGLYECIEYTSITSTQFTVANRGFNGTTAASALDNAVVFAGQHENDITHGFNYPPVHFVFCTSSPVSTETSSMVPFFIAQEGYIDAYVTDSILHVSIENLGNGGGDAPRIPSGTYDQYDFAYIIMADSLETPYY